MMATRNVGALLGDLRSRIGAIATALVGRNGLVVHAEMPEGSSPETFAVMCAAIYGAAGAANSELGHAPPERVVVEGVGSRTIIMGAGREALLVAVLPGSVEALACFGTVAKFADLLAAS